MDYDFSVDYDNTNVDIYKYLMKKHDIKSFLDKLWQIVLHYRVLVDTTECVSLKYYSKHTSCDCKCKFDIKHVIQTKNGVMLNVNAIVKSIIRAKNIIVGILAFAFVIIVVI